MDEYKGRITKLESDNQELKQMTTKVCLLINIFKKTVKFCLYFSIS
jgi:hypothetical protein